MHFATFLLHETDLLFLEIVEAYIFLTVLSKTIINPIKVGCAPCSERLFPLLPFRHKLHLSDLRHTSRMLTAATFRS